MKTKMIEKDIATDLANAYNEGFYSGEKDMEAHYETIVLPKVRKETAREILECLVEKLKDNVDGQNVDFFVDVKKFAEELAKQFGVEVE